MELSPGFCPGANRVTDPSLATVLIVEDNPDMSRALAAILSRGGFGRVEMTATAGEAHRLMRDQSIDLVVADWMVDALDGREFIRAVRRSEGATRPSVPVLVLTGHANGAHRRSARDQGPTFHMAKPISAEQLVATARQALESQPDGRPAPANAGGTRSRSAHSP